MRPIPRRYQELAVEHGLKALRERGKPEIVVSPTGSGKSVIISELCHQLNEPVLILQPSKEILEQNYAKLSSYGINDMAMYSASMKSKEIDKYTYATIGSIHKHWQQFKHFRYALIDECFPAGTFVDKVPIEELKVGQYVKSYNHTCQQVQLRKISRLFRKQIPEEMVRIVLKNGKEIHCTKNHPFFTEEYGYIRAENLTTGITLLYEHEEDMALHCLPEGMPTEREQSKSDILQRSLQTESDARENAKSTHHLLDMQEVSHFDRNEKGKVSFERKSLLFQLMRQDRPSCGCEKAEVGEGEESFIRKNEEGKSHVVAGSKAEDDSGFERQDISIPWREWSVDQTTAQSSRTYWPRDGDNSCNFSGERNATFITSSLQSRSGMSRDETCSRDRRKYTQVEEVEIPRQEKGTSLESIRVDYIEVYQRRSRQQSGEMRATDYVYNIEVEDNHNYFANGILAHNCQEVGAPRSMYRSFLKNLPKMKVLGLTATPFRMQQRFYQENGFGYYSATLRVQTQIYPAYFKDFAFKINIGKLIEEGYLAPIEYFEKQNIDIDSIPINSTGADFDERRMEEWMNTPDNVRKLVAAIVEEDPYTPNNLIFCSSIRHAYNTAEMLAATGYDCEVVTGNDPLRDHKIKLFREGKIKRLLNAKVMGIGFDFPGLNMVTLGAPTMSLQRLYQFCGRALRLDPDNPQKIARIVDVCNNIRRLGRIETIRITRNTITGKDQVETDRGIVSDKPLFTFKISKNTNLLNRTQ